MNDFLRTFYDGLTYSGNWHFILVNYFILSGTILIYLSTKLKRQNRAWWFVALFVTMIQILFWFMLEVQGISIIWNAMAGMLLHDYFRYRSKTDRTNRILIPAILLIVFAGDGYFAVIAPLITTIAHLSAIVLGSILALLFNRSKNARN